MEQRILSVTELNEAVKRRLDSEQSFRDLYVQGEISNFKNHPNGYCYFNLKDQNAVMSCIMFARNLGPFRPENGMKVLLRGRVSAYVKGGIYQFFASHMTPEGAGDLAVAFQQLKNQLHKEGLFDQAHKKPLPRFPERIAVITAATGDAVRDIVETLRHRYPLAKVLIMSVRVQGERAPREIVGAINYANRHKVADLIITGRGGGSMEDLWAFNDERVARAIYASELPVISAVGHEPDVTISDFVADARARTPTHAGQIAVPDQMELLQRMRSMQMWLEQNEAARLNGLQQRLKFLTSKRVMQDHLAYIQDKRLELFHIQKRLGDLFDGQLSRKRARFAALAAALDAMSPLKVFARGYAMVQNEEGQILRSWQDIMPDDKICVTLGEGGFTGKVDKPFGKEQNHGKKCDV